MLDGIDFTQVETVLRVAGGGGLFVWALLWLLRRGDALQRENIYELRRQRDDWRRRAEKAEHEIARHREAGCALTDHQ